MQSATADDHQTTLTVLVTGANSGLGFSACCRLIDEFLLTRPQSQTLHLITTTRSSRKSDDTILRLRQHLQNTLRSYNGKTLGISLLLEPRIRLEGELLDLTSLVSVKALSKRLSDRGLHLDVLILNAGVGGWLGLDWPRAIWGVLTDLPQSTTYPLYKRGSTGSVTKPQLPPREGKTDEEPKLGEVFTANVFGHYLLAHLLAPLMVGGGEEGREPGRIVWVSSLEAYPHSLRLEDLQALGSDTSYESSKRLTDLLVLTSSLPSTQPFVTRYLSPPNMPTTTNAEAQRGAAQPPTLYLAHPGICATSIAALPWILEQAMLLLFYVSRWVGSPWHTVTSYLGATSLVWLALTPLSTLSQSEAADGKAKWGSSCDTGGHERVIRTEVSGWGWGGRVGEKSDGGVRSGKNRWRGMKDVTKESREEFEETGRLVWREMEALRVEWEERLSGVAGDGEAIREL